MVVGALLTWHIEDCHQGDAVRDQITFCCFTNKKLNFRNHNKKSLELVSVKKFENTTQKPLIFVYAVKHKNYYPDATEQFGSKISDAL